MLKVCRDEFWFDVEKVIGQSGLLFRVGRLHNMSVISRVRVDKKPSRYRANRFPIQRLWAWRMGCAVGSGIGCSLSGLV